MLRDAELRERLAESLRKSADSKRIIQRFSLGRGDSDDLIALCKTIRVASDIASLLSQGRAAQKKPTADAGDSNASVGGRTVPRTCIDDILSRFCLDGPLDLANRIASAVDEEGVNQLHYMEEAESAAVAALAQQVENGQNVDEDADLVPSKSRMRGKSSMDSAKTVETDAQDVWIMRRRYGRDGRLWTARADRNT